MIIRCAELLCDECEQVQLVYADNLADAKQEAKARGWITTRTRECFCCQACHLRHSIKRTITKEENEPDIYIPKN
jgi:hypothetical protein